MAEVFGPEGSGKTTLCLTIIAHAQKMGGSALFIDAGKEHEEFKLRLNKERDIELAEINIRGDIAEHQSQIVGEALRSAKEIILVRAADTVRFLMSSEVSPKSLMYFSIWPLK